MGTAGWSAVVAVAVLLVIGAIAVTAMVQYPVSEAKQVLDWMAPLIAVVTGAFVGFFFTRGQVQASNQTAQTATRQAERAQNQARQALDQAQQAQGRASVLSSALTDVAGRLPRTDWEQMKEQNDALREAIQP
jgi:hypothetical protein